MWLLWSVHDSAPVTGITSRCTRIRVPSARLAGWPSQLWTNVPDELGLDEASVEYMKVWETIQAPLGAIHDVAAMDHHGRVGDRRRSHPSTPRSADRGPMP